MDNINKPHFKIHPTVVYQLGESLISDSIQALIELVKNSYDADASYVKITIDTTGTLDALGASYPNKNGRIIVEDDGHGMTRKGLMDSWLLISNRQKLDLKKAKKTTPGGRTPLGDKGLGRLGAQRLGENLEIFSKSKDKTAHHMAFSWLDFATAPSLESVEIMLNECPFTRPQGTTIVVSDLKEVAEWQGQSAINKLENELSQMISPYKEIRQFTVMVVVDGKTLDLFSISDKVREISPLRYNLSFDGDTFFVEGRARLDFFKPSQPKDAELFALMVEADNGKAFFEHLKQLKKSEKYHLTQSDQWFVEFHWKRRIGDLDKIEPDPNQIGKEANPGPFTGEVDAYNLGSNAFQGQNIFNRISEYRNHVKKISGIKIFRDGFRVRADHDWLKLGDMATSGGSYYGLRPINTLGYVSLSARENMALEETTDREGFKDTPTYRNFYELMQEFKKFTDQVQEFFGRGWNDFKNRRNEDLANIDTRKTIVDISHEIKKGLAEAGTYKNELTALHEHLEESAHSAQLITSKLASKKEITPAIRDEVTSALVSLKSLLDKAQKVIKQSSVYLEGTDKLSAMGQVLEDRTDALSRQMDYMFETVALGITAEALSHEVFNVADQLAERVKKVQSACNENGINDRQLLAFIEYVRSATMALRKQISFLSPSLRYVREKREVISIPSFMSELGNFYSDRLKKNNIKFSIILSGKQGFETQLNKGKLTQIIDNLVLNSEYWLKEDLSHGHISEGEIIIEVDRPFIRISDNGRGIDRVIEPALFEPFNSAKKRGRGLGLFIVKQLLDSEGCTIGIVPQRNDFQRLYKFQIDLRGAMND